jgi:predicted PurR-regulated permease PerM
MARLRSLSIVLIALLLVCSLTCVLQPVTAQFTSTPQPQSSLTSKLEAAATSIDQAFVAVLAVENVGANITSLITRLNEAANLLTQAQNDNATGNLITAENNADQAYSIAQEVLTLAQSELAVDYSASQNAKILTAIISVAGVVIFLVLLFSFWRRFKSNYIKNLAESTPEVSADEA